MKTLRKAHLLFLAGLVSCSGLQEKKLSVHGDHKQFRHIAQVDETLGNSRVLEAKVEKLITGVLQSYLMGQVFINAFDEELDKDPAGALTSDAYNSLLAIRTYVDQFEHDLNDLYYDLVMVTAYPQYDSAQKKNAQHALDVMGSFLDGLRSNREEIPENLKPLILSNLREKQTELYEELKAVHDGESDPAVKSVVYDNMILLRATRRSYFKDLKDYKVDPTALKKALASEKKKKSYKEFQKEIEALSKEMKTFTKELGRGTSSDVIFPSTTPNGNITGKSFPAKTWALTFDDGPAKTTSQVITNLVNKKIPATFFVLAKQAVAYPGTMKTMKDAGMDIASHSYTHAQLTKVGPVNLEKEITTAKAVIENQIGQPVKLFRLPYGAGVSVSSIRTKIAANKMIHVFWTVDTLDWQDKNPQSILARALKQMNATAKNAGVVLFHDIHPQSVIASGLLMDHLNENKLIACTVQGIIDQLNQGLASCK